MVALAGNALTGTVLTYVNIPGLTPLPLSHTVGIFVYAIAACLGMNDAIKVAMIKWRIPTAVA